MNQAVGLASQIGLTGLSIGALAEKLTLSKSGLFAHFRSKSALQVLVLETAAAQFAREVVKPAVKEPRGEPRVRALFENWVRWANSHALPGGCIFVTAAVELDDQPGPARDCLLRLQKEWLDVRRRVFQTGIDEGHFRPDADPDQFAQDLYGVMLAWHYSHRLLKDRHAEKKARKAFETILAAARKPKKS